MADQIAIVTFTTPGTAGTFPVTDSSITEAFKAAIFIWSGSDDDSADNVHHLAGVGACTTRASAGVAANRHHHLTVQGNNNALNAPDYNKHIQSAACIRVLDGTNANTTRILAGFSAAISGGVELNFTTVDATNPVKVTAILFAGLADASIRRVTSSLTATVNEDVGESPFYTPDVLVWFGVGGAGADTADAATTLGFTVRRTPIQQASACSDLDDTTEASNADGEVATASSIIGHSATRVMSRIAVSAFDASGFDFAGDNGAANIGAQYLALKFSGNFRASCAAMALPSSTGEASFNDFGFTPGLVFGMSTVLATADSTTDGATAGASGFFVTGSYGSRALTVHGQAGLSGTGISFNCHHRAEDVGLLTYEHTGTVAQRATWAGPSGAGGFILDFSVATTGYMVALGIQLGLSESDTEEISDQAVFAAATALAETEEITDSVVLSGTATIVVLETEEIADFVVLDAEAMSHEEGTPYGWTFAGGAERGGTFQGGAVAGTVL